MILPVFDLPEVPAVFLKFLLIFLSITERPVMSSRIMKKIAASEKEQDMLLTIQRLAGKTFQLKNGIWIENGIGDVEKVDITLKFLSDAYFKFSKIHPKLNRILALGEKVVFKWQGKTYRVQ